MSKIQKICLLGFGEVGNVLGKDLVIDSTNRLVAYDVQFDKPDSNPSLAARSHARIETAASAHEAVEGCDLVISAVTAGQALNASLSVAENLQPGVLFLDLNSVSPSSKLEVSKVIEAAGGRYVEAAVLSPIEPRRLAAPILVGGPYAEKFEVVGQELGFSGMRFFSQQIGKAAATKMCRSVMIKGIEALLAESLLTARHYGVEGEVLNSLNDFFPRPDWPQHARYMISRSIEHGVRRAEEMQEVCATVSESGLTPHMSKACALRQHWASQFTAALKQNELASMLDAINNHEAGQ